MSFNPRRVCLVDSKQTDPIAGLIQTPSKLDEPEIKAMVATKDSAARPPLPRFDLMDMEE